MSEVSQKFGDLRECKKYCLKTPGVLGGVYGANNLGTISFGELVCTAGHIARQIKDLPDGAKI